MWLPRYELSVLFIVHSLTFTELPKENAQETFITIIGLIFGLLFAKTIANYHASTWTFFIALTIIHTIANYKAVKCLRLSTVNRTRAWLLVMNHLEDSKCITNMSVESINSQESAVLSLILMKRSPWIGARLSDVLHQIQCTSQPNVHKQFEENCDAFYAEMYCIIPLSGRLCAVIKKPEMDSGLKQQFDNVL